MMMSRQTNLLDGVTLRLSDATTATLDWEGVGIVMLTDLAWDESTSKWLWAPESEGVCIHGVWCFKS